jgi:hypothetical protein
MSKESSDEYFTEREEGTLARTELELTDSAWAAIVALLTSRIRDGSLGEQFPLVCQEYTTQTVGTDEDILGDAIAGEIPALGWPLPRESPGPGPAMDLLEFVDRNIADVESRHWHDYFRHHHLEYDAEPGRANWRRDAGRILRRNGLAFEFDGTGRVVRLGDPVTRARLSILPATGDQELDEMLARASDLYFTPDEDLHREALLHLWRVFERMKSALDDDKKASTGALLDLGADEATLRAILEADSFAMTRAGNVLTIRHSEVGKVPIEREDQVDYLFGRLFNLVWLLVPLLAEISEA